MPCLIRILTPAGLHPAPYTADSLADAGQHEPHEGVYTITNTFNRTDVLKLNAHLDRMEDSARQAGITLTLDRPRLRAALRTMIEEADYGDVRFRITAPASPPDQFILSIEPFNPLSAEVYAHGVAVVSVPDAARHNPAAKTTDWMQNRAAIERALPPGTFTGLLLDDHGLILEGLSSNFYAIFDDELRTAGAGVLPGIAQQIVFAVAPAVLPVRKDAIALADVPRIDEAFITSASRGIVPVVRIDDHVIGGGIPGTRTLALRAAYAAWMADHLEPL